MLHAYISTTHSLHRQSVCILFLYVSRSVQATSLCSKTTKESLISSNLQLRRFQTQLGAESKFHRRWERPGVNLWMWTTVHWQSLSWGAAGLLLWIGGLYDTKIKNFDTIHTCGHVPAIGYWWISTAEIWCVGAEAGSFVEAVPPPAAVLDAHAHDARVAVRHGGAASPHVRLLAHRPLARLPLLRHSHHRARTFDLLTTYNYIISECSSFVK